MTGQRYCRLTFEIRKLDTALNQLLFLLQAGCPRLKVGPYPKCHSPNDAAPLYLNHLPANPQELHLKLRLTTRLHWHQYRPHQELELAILALKEELTRQAGLSYSSYFGLVDCTVAICYCLALAITDLDKHIAIISYYLTIA